MSNIINGVGAAGAGAGGIGNLTADIKEAYTSQKGALIMGVGEDSPAAKAGLKRGDLITKVDGKEIENANALKNLIGSFEPNSEVAVEYERGGKINKVKIRLANMDAPSEQSTNSSSINGLEISNLSNEIMRKYKLPSIEEELLIKHGKHQVYGVLSTPDNAQKRHPIVIVSHGFNGAHHHGRN